MCIRWERIYIFQSVALTSRLYDSGKNASRVYFPISNWYCFVAHMFWTRKAGAKTSYSARFCAICLLVVYDTLPTGISWENTIKTQKSVEVEAKEILLWLYTT